jgi:hypothetical protein
MKKIEFIPQDILAEQVVDPPIPASKILPEWFKKTEPLIYKGNAHRNPDKTSNKTLKLCMPFLDAMSSGYMITLPCDVIFVDPNQYGARVLWDVSWNVLEGHTEGQIGYMPLLEGYNRNPLKWSVMWSLKTPSGYSLLYTHPLNRFDLPFFTMSGIVDTDNFEIPVNLPFIIKEGFMGKIPKGTPLAQVIPIKRESWKSTIEKPKIKNTFLLDKLRTVVDFSYKIRWWNKKSYE